VPPAEGVERADVRLFGWGFEPHRHDTYTIGMTTIGVQTFRYRGAREVSLPGELVILHPDEAHDGVAGTDAGFGYRAVYVAPELIRDAIGGRALPFVAYPVQRVMPVCGTNLALIGLIHARIGPFRCPRPAAHASCRATARWLSPDVEPVHPCSPASAASDQAIDLVEGPRH
jgi:hypothetical protein